MDAEKAINLLAGKHNDTVDVIMNYRNFFVSMLLILTILCATSLIIVVLQGGRLEALERQVAELSE